MLQEIELDLLYNQVFQLKNSSYFNIQIKQFCEELLNDIQHLKKNIEGVEARLLRRIIDEFWCTLQYLSGSATNETPYEMQVCLGLALKDWQLDECIITTALNAEREFHFNPSQTWNTFDSVFQIKKDRNILVQFALPRIYKHHPLLNVALYHEVGHYVDAAHAVIEASIQKSSELVALSLDAEYLEYCSTKAGADLSRLNKIERNHREEFFADLIACCYTGTGCSDYLDNLDPDETASETHPSTKIRTAVVTAYIQSKSNSIIALFADSLSELKLPGLFVRFEEPAITDDFIDVRPTELSSIKQIHGLIPAAWKFFRARGNIALDPWTTLNAEKSFDLINDLTEKSIRSYEIKRKWDAAQ